MHVIQADNVNSALATGLEYILNFGVEEPSRNGPVLVSPIPVTTVYRNPCARVLFSPMRDANPFFHLMESLWMLAGRNDLRLPQYFNKRFAEYSDDGHTVRAAYGHRWRKWFGYDQLEVIARELRENPASRRCVLAMWDAGKEAYYQCPPDDAPGDLLASTVDKPCNTHIYFRVNKGVLDMTACCRSNDILWGAYGANAVHMSVLQEFMAAWIGVGVGVYYQISNNFHLYTAVLSKDAAANMAADAERYDYYCSPLGRAATPMPLLNGESIEAFQAELLKFLHTPFEDGFESLFIRAVAQPMAKAYAARKDKTGTGAAEVAKIGAQDWYIACEQWIQRREAKKEIA